MLLLVIKYIKLPEIITVRISSLSLKESKVKKSIVNNMCPTAKADAPIENLVSV